ncbi:probable uridine nucleosidase 1 [Diachasma alloeum]|uniref:probable uridine nucleosidase 1 n=1 Tax=Diachasma alloeum TaxID=454923 RepID=UPI0007382CFF|nr:probable uridine nucleosidase 1 [Diachasma alloeum]
MQKKFRILLFIGLCVTALINSAQSEKLVIDTDAGGDDAVAILLVLSVWAANDSNFEVVGITCTYGNTVEKNVEMNVLQTLTIANMSQIPVYGGAQKPLTRNFTTDYFFGANGFGDFEFDEEITAAVDRSKHAAVALVDLARKYRGELSVLSMGPLTNIALAISLDPNFIHNVKRFYVMGGSVSGVGNIAPGVEFNFAADPESNFILFNSTRGEPIFLLPWETTSVVGLPMKWRTEVLGSIDSRTMRFLNQVERKILPRSSVWRSADLMTAAFMLWPHLITKSVVTNITPVFDGAARGVLLVDYGNSSGKMKNAEIIQNGDSESVKQLLIKYFQ